MATLVLGTVGRVFGGPVGGIVGTLAGGFVDRAVLGGRSGGSGRVANLTVQSAAYGEAIPVVTGRMRVAGNLIWSAGIVENAGSAGKRNGGSSASGYVYTASFAVGLGAGPIARIGRVWADGRLIREANGTFLTPTVMRLHVGGEGQGVDPLIAAAEGSAGTPAYRGIAYAVFEDLALVDFGNRIPNLTFEVIASDGAVDLGTAISALAKVDGRSVATVSGEFPVIAGHFAGGDGSIADNIAGPINLAGASVMTGSTIEIVAGVQEDYLVMPGDRGTRAVGGTSERESLRRLGGGARIDGFEVSYFDVDRDYQLGLQRASRGVGGIVERQMVEAAMSAEQAKTLAAATLSRLQAANLQTAVRLPWRYLDIRPGMAVRTIDAADSWRVRGVRFENFVVHLDLERRERSAPVALPAASGRALAFADSAPGPTTLAVVDLPLLPGEALAASRLWVAAAGASDGWRRADVEMSVDGGITYNAVGSIRQASVMGEVVSTLPNGPTSGWDCFSSVDVVLLSDQMWLESRPAASVLAGSNLAMIGDELLQFTMAEAVAPQTFRLSGLLRGRRGTEHLVADHKVGEKFLLIDQAAMLPCVVPSDLIGSEVRFRPLGGDDAGALPVVVAFAGRAAQPLSPVHIRLQYFNGDLVATWVRRSRDGFAWADFVDAPIGEFEERYRVALFSKGRLVREAEVAEPRFVYTSAMQAADGGGADLSLSISQIGVTVGQGRSAIGRAMSIAVGDA